MARNAPGIENPSPATGFRVALAFYPGCGLRESYRKDYAPYAPVSIFLAAEDEEVSPAICEELVAVRLASTPCLLGPGSSKSCVAPG
jgi:carboxymethylenebutenolidase